MKFEDLFSVKGKVALVTGGSRGIGRMIAEGLIAHGAKVYISSRKADACQRTADELGPNCIPLPADVSTVAGCEVLASALTAKESALDILVNNAGLAWGATFEDFPETGWDRVMDLNLKAPFFLTQKLYSLLKTAASEHRPAKVINIGSVDGMRLNPWETYSYHASKAAILFLTRRLAARLVADRIIVNAIAPGFFASDMNRAARDRADEAGAVIPAGRVGRDEDIVAAAIYLAARSGDYVAGETLTVDGGLVYATLGPGTEF